MSWQVQNFLYPCSTGEALKTCADSDISRGTYCWARPGMVRPKWKGGGQGGLFRGLLHSSGGPHWRRVHYVSEYPLDSSQANSTSLSSGQWRTSTPQEAPLLHCGGWQQVDFWRNEAISLEKSSVICRGLPLVTVNVKIWNPHVMVSISVLLT